jgi:hypothetical protein
MAWIKAKIEVFASDFRKIRIKRVLHCTKEHESVKKCPVFYPLTLERYVTKCPKFADKMDE